LANPPTIDPRSDAQLITAINAGDERAFEAIYFRYRDWAASLALRFTGRADDAADVVQETFAYFASKFPGFKLTAKFTTFLYPAIKNISISLARERRREVSDEKLLADAAAVAGAADPSSARRELATVMSALPEIQREVVLLRFVDDLDLQEIADVLRIPLGTVKSRLHLALQSARQSPVVRKYFEPS
jgi:RNA polymerase sigma-70 factor (ECF subfamily)